MPELKDAPPYGRVRSAGVLEYKMESKAQMRTETTDAAAVAGQAGAVSGAAIPVEHTDTPELISDAIPGASIADPTVDHAGRFERSPVPTSSHGPPNGANGAARDPDSPMDAEAAAALILASGLFDASYYRRQCGLPEQGLERLVRHYIQSGAAAGFDPNPLFDSDWYFETYPHAKSTGMNPFAYYIAHASLQTNPHMLFDLEYYLAQKPSLRREGTKSPLLHYYTEGWFAERDPHPLFSVREYLDAYPDVRDAVCEPLSHYISTGWREGRNPSKYFSTSYYLANNPDVAKAGANPFVHYMQYGFREGRDPSADCENEWYLSQLDPAEAKRNLNPLVHYRMEGERKGLSPKLTNLALAKDFSLSSIEFENWLSRILVAWRKRRALLDEPGRVTLWLLWTNTETSDISEATAGTFIEDSSTQTFQIRTHDLAGFSKTGFAKSYTTSTRQTGQGRAGPQPPAETHLPVHGTLRSGRCAIPSLCARAAHA